MNKKDRVVGEEKKSQLHTVTFSSNNETTTGLKSSVSNLDELESYKMLRAKRKKIAVYRMILWVVLIVFIPIFIFMFTVITNPSKGHNFFGLNFYFVVSDSMTPEINVNDCIVVRRVKTAKDIKVGDDITFIRSTDGQTITHRVIDITEEDGQILFSTKGIHNPTMDEGRVSFENVIGVRVATIGWLGQIIMFFRTTAGIITFLGLFVLIMLAFLLSFRISNDIRAVNNRLE